MSVEKKEFYCAFDMGASSGRVMVGEWDGHTLQLSEMHRFANEPVMMGDVLYWDIFRLFHEMKVGLKKIATEKIPLSGIGIDTWGVDYAWLDAQGNMIGLPIHYRDQRTEGTPAKLGLSPEALYDRTGIQFLIFNTIYQLIADLAMRPDVLRQAADLLFMPDLLAYFLTGQKCNEYTIASTSQLLNPFTRTWDWQLLDQFSASAQIPAAAQYTPGFFRDKLKPLVMPGTVIGPLSEAVRAETGINPEAKLIAVGTHDTASAVAGTPLANPDSVYLISGTWSLVGMELDKPLVSPESRTRNFTNEGGVYNTIRFLKNVNGLWMIQQLRKHYKDQGRSLGYADLIREAERAENKTFTIPPNDTAFLNPKNMAEAIAEHCMRTGQGKPQSIGETVMAVYNGLADECAAVLQGLSDLRQKEIHTLHMVGGGIQDTLLCRLTAQQTQKRVLAGPVEASVLGSIVTQMAGLGSISGIAEGRAIIRRSFTPVVY